MNNNMLAMLDGNMVDTLTQLSTIMYILKFTPATSYTAFNICALIYSCICLPQNASVFRILTVNTLALHKTFYATGLLVDNTFMKRMIERFGVSSYVFFLGDIIAHCIPTIICLMLTYMRTNIKQDNVISFSQASIYSIGLNLLWGLFNPPHYFNLDNIYAQLTNKQWTQAWFLSIIFHMTSAWVLKKISAHTIRKQLV